MTVRMKRTGTPATMIEIPDSANLTIGAGEDFAQGIMLKFDGAVSGYGGGYQQVFSLGTYTKADNLLCNFQPLDASSQMGTMYFEIDGATTQRCRTPAIEAGGEYILVIQRVAGVWTSKLCPVQSVAPVDGSAVITSAGYSHTAALDPIEPLIIGGYNNTGRRLDQTISRFFRINRGLTDFEIAQLAYGKEITAFTTPKLYLRLNDMDDYADQGSQNNPVTVAALTTGAEPGFGYSSVPTAPVIAAKPTIIGSPSIGNPTGYQKGTATGNPSPTTTQQWSINGVDIVGATDTTYTPIAADVGKLLRVRQIETNGVNPAAVSTSDPALVAAAASSLTPAEFAVEAVFQQVNGIALVPVSATFTGAAPATLEYQLYDSLDGTTITKPWANTNLAPANSKFEGNVPMPTPANGRKNKIAYRTKNGAGDVMFTSPIMSNRFGIGDIYLGIGSSSMAGWFGSGSGSNMVVDHNLVSTEGGSSDNPAWALFGQYGQAGQMAMYWAKELNYPVAFVGLGLGGSTLSDWSNINSSVFAGFINWVNYVGGKIAGVFSTCGSNDISTSSLTPSPARTVQAHLDYLHTLAANIRQVTGQPTLPIFKSGISRRGTDTSQTAWTTDERANNARKAEQLFGDEPNNIHIQTLQFEMGPDGVHLTGNGYIGCTQVVRYVALQKIKFGQYIRGPKIQSLRFNGDKVNVELLHRSGNDITPLTNIEGFVVTDEKQAGVFTPVTYVASRTDANNILLTCDQVLVKPKVTYMGGANPNYPNQGFDNTPITPLPINYEVFMDTVPGALVVPKVLVPYYNEFTFDREIMAGTVTPPPPPPPVSTGSFTSHELVSSGTLRIQQSCKYTWYAGGVVGQTAGNASMGTVITNNQGRAVMTGLPLGPGFMLMSFADGGKAYQEGTVA